MHDDVDCSECVGIERSREQVIKHAHDWLIVEWEIEAKDGQRSVESSCVCNDEIEVVSNLRAVDGEEGGVGRRMRCGVCMEVYCVRY